jgi:hypothetical protein
VNAVIHLPECGFEECGIKEFLRLRTTISQDPSRQEIGYKHYAQLVLSSSQNFKTNNTEIFFRIINDFVFVHTFIFDRTFVDFTVSLLILPFYIVDFNSKMVKSTVNP